MKTSQSIQKILVPTDFSPEALNAMSLGAQIARKVEGELDLLYVINYPGGSAFNTMMAEYEDPASNAYIQEVLKDVKEVFDKHLNAQKFKGIKVVRKIQIGNPFTNISDEISQNNTDLVVMGTKGAGGMKGTFVGSNTEKVVRRVDCPVISLKDHVDLKNIKTIVFPTRFEKESAPIVNFLKNFQETINAKIRMVYINTPAYFQTERSIRKHVDGYVKRYELKSFKFDIYNELTEEKGILAFATDINADLIAMETHGRRGISHLFAGSIAEELVNHSKRPVLTIKVKI